MEGFMPSFVRPLGLVFFMAIAGVPAITVVSTSGCAGKAAREEVLVPAMRLASYGVEDDALVGVETLPLEIQEANRLIVKKFFGIIRDGDDAGIRLEAIGYWGRVRELADTGIEAKLEDEVIGESVAKLLSDRVSDFDRALRAYITRSPAMVD